MIIRSIFYILIIMINGCSSSSLLLERLRRQKNIAFQSQLSSPTEFSINEGSPFRLTCAFLSSFDKIDIFWFHNETLIQSFISKTIQEEEDDEVENTFLASTIISTIEIAKTNIDMNGLYKCIGIHKELYSQQTFQIHVVSNETNSIQTSFSEDALFTVHTYQSLFEPRSQTTIMCRFGDNKKNKCTTKWFDPVDEPIDTLGEKTDLILKNANFEDHMGSYTCHICCHNQCQLLTSFVYPAAADK